ncbi:MAG: hypothetical protein Harvfovirus33_2 [Harvfovirus sp.]|uniref:Uncharacterized protein n=1 Tax=Harvfovirus sp. TaxID=2487768 RepID=A0A3G5A4K7_9VIRU|nr:MAG: hypothetical protein Harvfovirus33_2 [Harvfovirus sp.]
MGYHYNGYGAAARKDIEGIQDILTWGYRYYDSTFAQDCVKLFKILEDKGEHLTDKEIELFVRKLTLGKTKSLIGRNSIYVEGLSALTKKHLLTDKQINTIIGCFNPKNITSLSFKWVDNLILQKYELSSKTRNTLIALGYTAGIDIILNQNESNIDEFNAICNMKEINIEKIQAYVKKFKIVPTLDSVDIIVGNYVAHQNNPYGYGYNYGQAVKAQKDELEHLLKIIEIFTAGGLEVSLEFIVKIIKYMPLDRINDYVEKLFTMNVVRSGDDISVLINSQNHNVMVMNNLVFVFGKCVKYKISLGLNVLRGMLIATYIYVAPGVVGDVGISDKINPLKYFYRGGHLGNEIMPKYFGVINLFLENSTDEISELELLEHACLISDRLVFDILLKRLGKFTSKCLINACASGFTEMLQVFFNMKALASIECLEVIPHGSIVLFTLLLNNGLPVNLKTIEVAMLKGLYIDNLSDNYGFQADVELYKLCHRLSLFPENYVVQMKNVAEINMDVRYMIVEELTDDGVKAVIKIIEDRGIVPDSMMYDDALEMGIYALVKYFEEEWGMKLNLTSILRICSLSERMKYLDVLVNGGIISKDVVTTKAVLRNVVAAPVEPVVVKKKVKKLVVKGKKKKKQEPVDYTE